MSDRNERNITLAEMRTLLDVVLLACDRQQVLPVLLVGCKYAAGPDEGRKFIFPCVPGLSPAQVRKMLAEAAQGDWDLNGHLVAE